MCNRADEEECTGYVVEPQSVPRILSGESKAIWGVFVPLRNHPDYTNHHGFAAARSRRRQGARRERQDGHERVGHQADGVCGLRGGRGVGTEDARVVKRALTLLQQNLVTNAEFPAAIALWFPSLTAYIHPQYGFEPCELLHSDTVVGL